MKRTRPLMWTFSLFALVAGCAKKVTPPEGATTPAGAVATSPTTKPTTAEASPTLAAGASADGVDKASSAETAPTPVPEKAAPRVAKKFADALLTSIRHHVEAQGLSDDDTRRALELTVGKVKRFRRLITAAYQARNYRRVLGAGTALDENGRMAVELIRDVSTHGLEPSPYPVKTLDKAITDYDAALAELTRLTAPDKTTATGKLVSVVASFEPRDDESYADQRRRVANQLLELGFSDNDPFDAMIHDVDAWTDKTRALDTTVRQAVVALDVYAVQGFFQYALDFKHLVVAHPYTAQLPDEVARAPEKYKKELAADFAEAAEHLASSMRAMWPRHPYYQKTRAALAKYQALADQKTVPELKLRGQLKRGAKGPKVIDLQRRLAAEGYYQGDVTSEEFGDELEAAVVRYQKHHQLKADGIVRDTGGPDGNVKKNLAIPMAERVRQLKLSLQRWREFASGSETAEMYFRVNIPQFEVEVWDDKDELVRKHRIVVGNNKYEIDQDHGRKGHLNRTALITNSIQMVVLNPVWNVPDRIKIAEVLPDAAKDPTYMERHGYKVRTQPDGTEQLYQEAGSDNALGQIKILFPNEYAIYMHDTPKKNLFDRTLRAFSHGCMRLHDPVGMATFLLGRDGQVSTSKVAEILRLKKERAFKLKRPIPIHIEYNTITFDGADDEPVFLGDVYGYDDAFWKGEVPVVREEEIPVVKTELPMPEWERDDDPREDGEAPVPTPTFDPDAPARPAGGEKAGDHDVGGEKNGEKPARDKPAVDKPAVDKPAVDKPAVDKPAVDKPAREKPAADKTHNDNVDPDDRPAGAPPAHRPKPARGAEPG